MDELSQLNPGLNRWATDPAGPHRLHLPVDKLDTFRTNLGQLEPEQRTRWQRYRIRPGDTLSSIAARHGINQAQLMRANQLEGSRLRAGRQLFVPRPPGPEETDSPLLQATEVKETEYRVRSGDSLWGIARRHQIGHHELADWNGISARDPLRPGQRLIIRQLHSDSAGPQKVSTGSSEFRDALSYRVRKGDSLYTISRRFKVSVADLKRWNELKGGYLQPGQRLMLYADVPQQQAL